MPKYPKQLSPGGKKEIIRCRGGDSDKSGKKGPAIHNLLGTAHSLAPLLR